MIISQFQTLDGDRMNNKYSMTIDYSPAYELVTSFYTFILKKDLKSLRLGNDWWEETKEKLPASFARELEDERWEILHRTVLLISQCPQKETASGFLSWFERLPAGELYERLAPRVQSIPLHLSEIRDRSHYLLAQWHEHYFTHVSPEILTQLQHEAKVKSKLAEDSAPIDVIEQLTNGMRIEPTDQLQQVILVPQYHCYPTNIIDFYRGMATCLYPAKLPAISEDPASVFLQRAQCVADEKRLEILRYLAKGPRTLIGLHQHVKLAKSTVHHHITTLRRSGLIRSHFIDHTTRKSVV